MDEQTGKSRAESFLRMIRKSRRGKLKIYLGYAAGVGKTWQMLLEAHRLKDSGIDVVAGLVETHGRKETAALVQGLETVPLLKIPYKSIEMEDLDLAAVLKRRPEVVLVDELAHTNPPGSRNAKRHQDVEDLLDAGIHVISTLNVQHLESLYETVERAVGVKVRERIPDRIVLEADQIVNVDITAEDLIQRLKDGKIYGAERIETALDHFFKPVNLEQLRELTLRELAAQIDSRQREPHTAELPSSPDQVMVCLSSRGPNSEALLRYASRLAGRLNRNWYAVYVQTRKERPTAIDATTQRLLARTLTLAHQLGATVFTYKGDDVVKTLLEFAREYRVGHLVIGSPGKSIPFFKRLRGEVTIMERLVTEGRGLTVVVLDTRTLPDEKIPEEKIPVEPEKSGAAPGRKNNLQDIIVHAPVLVWKTPTSKDEAVDLLVSECFRDNPNLLISAGAAIRERESLGGTYAGEGVALPHARLKILSKPRVAFGLSRNGIQDPESGKTIRLMVLLLSPDAPPETHVEALSEISRLIRDEGFRKAVVQAERKEDLQRLISRRVLELCRDSR
jgi:two-component system sensor histidine kinase KdpD